MNCTALLNPLRALQGQPKLGKHERWKRITAQGARRYRRAFCSFAQP